MLAKLEELKASLEGDLFTDNTIRTLYATDASVYRELPLAVARPRNSEDIRKLIAFAAKYKTSLIPRTAGTSLAGQVVGPGIVVDVSKYMTAILEVNQEEKWVRVQPGVVLDELNKYLKEFGLFFGPETSTANRCMIGGMVGNNSCGSHSIIYGTTRDHLLEVKGFLSDGSAAHFGEVSAEEFEEKCQQDNLEGNIYKHFKTILSDKQVAEEIQKEFPKPSIRRRNTGYAIDELLECQPFTSDGDKFNMCRLLAGSEGTLAFMTEIKLNLVDVPPPHKAVVAVHLNTIDESTRANLIALKYNPGAVELIDNIILECTKQNIEQTKNRFFVLDDPGALLVVEFARETREEIEKIAEEMEAEMRDAGLGYHFPVLYGGDIGKVWALRKAGLGLLANVPGDPKAVACIEDTAVDVEDQPDFIREFQEILKKHNMECVFYAHIGDGEIHLRPILDLKKEEDRQRFFTITDEVASLVKKYKGSLSGEHGDGRVRGEFLRKMIGEKNYELVVGVKSIWDPYNIFNPGKIVHTPKMNEFLRYESGQKTNEFNTVFDFSDTEGILRMAEKCNGSGDCRKSHVIGGTMCPSFMATRNEKDTTRARANILREFLTRSPKENKFDHDEIYEVMDLCISCKGCKSECPSNVDMATLKAEFLQNYYEARGVPFRAKMIANFGKANKINSNWPGLANFVQKNPVTGKLLKKVLGIAQQRPLPELSKITLRKWLSANKSALKPRAEISRGKVNLFCDEYTNYNESEIGITAIKLLTRLGYEVVVPKHLESGRTYLSKGLVKDAQKIVQKNLQYLQDKVSPEVPLLGIEPSAILSFRDEYLRLAGDKLLPVAKKLASSAFTIDEFIASEIDKGHITLDQFTAEEKKIKLHGHCHQKALSSVSHTVKMLSLPDNYFVEVIPSGCCGMAGSFGYEKEHYDISMQIGELVLFPAVRKSSEETIIAAPGTSCRHQIKDGTERKAWHPVEIMYNALK
ncbi:FAD-linked oxidase C-terminal domain-containing protein [Cytophagaceae bacterium ABcell3]|nr:FAD-linked oxidase C-terminal domain-containing protein [Cytophagaceae bacterium ABcell3]